MNKRLQEASKFVRSFPSPFPLHFVSNSSFTPGDEPSVSPGDLELPRYFSGLLPARAIGESDAWRNTGKISEAATTRNEGTKTLPSFWIFIDIYIYIYIYIYVYIYIYLFIYLIIYIYIYQQITKKTQMHQSYIHIHIYLPTYWLILTMILALDMASRGFLHPSHSLFRWDGYLAWIPWLWTVRRCAGWSFPMVFDGLFQWKPYADRWKTNGNFQWCICFFSNGLFQWSFKSASYLMI